MNRFTARLWPLLRRGLRTRTRRFGALALLRLRLSARLLPLSRSRTSMLLLAFILFPVLLSRG